RRSAARREAPGWGWRTSCCAAGTAWSRTSVFRRRRRGPHTSASSLRDVTQFPSPRHPRDASAEHPYSPPFVSIPIRMRATLMTGSLPSTGPVVRGSIYAFVGLLLVFVAGLVPSAGARPQLARGESLLVPGMGEADRHMAELALAKAAEDRRLAARYEAGAQAAAARLAAAQAALERATARARAGSDSVRRASKAAE